MRKYGELEVFLEVSGLMIEYLLSLSQTDINNEAMSMTYLYARNRADLSGLERAERLAGADSTNSSPSPPTSVGAQ